jgi:hypothetical protein
MKGKECAMKFCPECGSAVQPEAKFCVNCGQPLGLSATTPERARIHIPPGFAAVFLIVLVVGLAAAGILIRQHRKEQAQQESAKTSSELPPGHPQVELPRGRCEKAAQGHRRMEPVGNRRAAGGAI